MKRSRLLLHLRQHAYYRLLLKLWLRALHFYPDRCMTLCQIEFAAVFERGREGYIAFVEELPSANTQGDTLEEARENLLEAIQLALEANRALAEESIRGRNVLKERLTIALSA